MEGFHHWISLQGWGVPYDGRPLATGHSEHEENDVRAGNNRLGKHHFMSRVCTWSMALAQRRSRGVKGGKAARD